MRSLIFLVMMVVGVTATYAQELRFKKLSWWNPEYPTVVNAGRITMYNDAYGCPSDHEIIETKKIPGMSDFCISSGAWEIGLMWTLKSIDGVDLKSLSDDQKSDFLNNPSNHKFSWETPYVKSYTTIGIPFINREFIYTLNVDFDNCDDIHASPQQYHQKKTGYDVLVDWDIDWSKIRTYDYLILGNDPLTDKKILEEFAKSLEPPMTRDTNSPDVLFTIAKDSESSVTYSYVPPKIDYIKTGSTTKKVYNWVGQNPKYSTTDHYQKVEQQGYTKEINHAEIFLEICMLDASKLEQSTPPIIYKGSVKKSYNRKVNILDKYLYYASNFGHPIMQKFVVRPLKFNETIPYALRWGIASSGDPDHFDFVTKDKPAQVTMIYRPSLRLVKGEVPEIGDIITDRKYKNHRVHSGIEWNDIEFTYKSSNGKKHKFTLLSTYDRQVMSYMRGDYWFKPYLVTVEE